MIYPPKRTLRKDKTYSGQAGSIGVLVDEAFEGTEIAYGTTGRLSWRDCFRGGRGRMILLRT